MTDFIELNITQNDINNFVKLIIILYYVNAYILYNNEVQSVVVNIFTITIMQIIL